MKSLVIVSVFILLVGLLFYSLFKQPINKNTTEIRMQLREAEIQIREANYAKRQLGKCRRNLFEDAHEYVDSLVRSLDMNPANEQDNTIRRYRPDINFPDTTLSKLVPLEPLFEKVDSLY